MTVVKEPETPLISHARLRAMFQSLVEVQAIYGIRKYPIVNRVEGCFVGTAIDLMRGDLTSGTTATEDLLLKHIRAAGGRKTHRPATQASILRLFKLPPPDAFPGTTVDRVVCALGAAMAQETTGQGRVVMAYLWRDEVTAAQWKRILPLMSQRNLPFIIILLPGATATNVEQLATNSCSLPELRVPVIPVDAGDAVAVYRVAQESVVRARSNGGAAIIEAIACGTNPLSLLREQLLHKRVCTARWLDAAEYSSSGQQSLQVAARRAGYTSAGSR